MKQISTFILLFLLTILSILAASCSSDQPETKKELLIYSGITMIHPMSEIADIIEEQENCEIIITKGGSGNLLDSIRVNQVGDLYLPGSDSYIETAVEEGLVSEHVPVGYNQIAIMVQEGNPKEITSDLMNFTNTDYYIVLGNPDSGSVGKETKRTLEAKGIYEEVINNTRRLTTDSKDLTAVLINGEADLVINWYATATWPENAPYIDAIPIDEEYAKIKQLRLGLLTTSKHPDIARKFMDYATSPEGQALFAKYGLQTIAP